MSRLAARRLLRPFEQCCLLSIEFVSPKSDASLHHYESGVRKAARTRVTKECMAGIRRYRPNRIAYLGGPVATTIAKRVCDLAGPGTSPSLGDHAGTDSLRFRQAAVGDELAAQRDVGGVEVQADDVTCGACSIGQRIQHPARTTAQVDRPLSFS